MSQHAESLKAAAALMLPKIQVPTLSPSMAGSYELIEEKMIITSADGLMT